MEFVGCAASVSQLLVYLSSSAVNLQRLYSELVHCNSNYRDEATNIRLLLHTLQRLGRQHLDDDDNSPVLPVLISISGTACQVLHLLKPKRLFGINWAPVTSQNKISSAFETLNKKRNLLHLYISQEHQEALVDLRHTVESFCKFKMKGGRIAGHASMFSGPMRGSADVEFDDYTVDKQGAHFLANATGDAERMYWQSNRHNTSRKRPENTHTPVRALIPPANQENHAGGAAPTQQGRGSERDSARPNMNESRQRDSHHSQTEDRYRDGSGQPPAKD
ncbi:hypothetical protein COCMIDRAFT_3933 [Bipolaris oryzae ATCC 44560]|uniref:Uncharacterized protein n=1 Tax=Bipolaris oryzae ATCC 44560 TaxID=930090 RepID=W6Z5P5_COCMI|nr:uncharacterized protein COCMIDRAFT_3933 [Bipolaris oryzae ATCC 44560]EUC47077.1 hypothetical protein COCMIDRAFT_3933 [Bipolaris oryzae ATCC 44560]